MSRARWRSFLPPAPRAQCNNSAAALAGIGEYNQSLSERRANAVRQSTPPQTRRRTVWSNTSTRAALVTSATRRSASGSLARISQLQLTTLLPYALGKDAGSGSGAFRLGGLPIPGQQFGDLPGRVIGNAGQASKARLIS